MYVYGVCMLYRIWCIEPVEPPWLARGGSDRTSRTPPGYGHGYYNQFVVLLESTQISLDSRTSKRSLSSTEALQTLTPSHMIHISFFMY